MVRLPATEPSQIIGESALGSDPLIDTGELVVQHPVRSNVDVLFFSSVQRRAMQLCRVQTPAETKSDVNEHLHGNGKTETSFVTP
jgi:hypothetical protein